MKFSINYMIQITNLNFQNNFNYSTYDQLISTSYWFRTVPYISWRYGIVRYGSDLYEYSLVNHLLYSEILKHSSLFKSKIII